MSMSLQSHELVAMDLSSPKFVLQQIVPAINTMVPMADVSAGAWGARIQYTPPQVIDTGQSVFVDYSDFSRSIAIRVCRQGKAAADPDPALGVCIQHVVCKDALVSPNDLAAQLNAAMEKIEAFLLREGCAPIHEKEREFIIERFAVLLGYRRA